MIEANSPEINVEDLMRHIREEILKQKHQLDQSSAPGKADGQIAEKQSDEIADFLVCKRVANSSCVTPSASRTSFSITPILNS